MCLLAKSCRVEPCSRNTALETISTLGHEYLLSTYAHSHIQRQQNTEWCVKGEVEEGVKAQQPCLER